MNYLLSGLTEDINKTWQNVNYNAKNSKGEYPCRVNSCYTKTLVEKTIKSYQKLVANGKIRAYTPTSTDKKSTVDGVANDILMFSQRDRIAAILYEYYWVSHPAEAQTPGSANETTAPSIFNATTIAIGLVLGSFAAWFSGKSKKKGKR